VAPVKFLLCVQEHVKFQSCTQPRAGLKFFPNAAITHPIHSIEDKFRRPVERGFIFLVPREEIVPIDITTERKMAAQEALAQIRRSIDLQVIPDPTEVRARCGECE